MRRTDLMLSVLFYAVLITLLAFAGQVFATAPQQPPKQEQWQGQGQAQGQIQGQGQAQSTNIGIGVATRASAAAFAGGGNASAGGASSNNTMTINEASGPSKVTIRNNPDISSGNIYPTAPCMGSSSAGFSGGSIGLVFGTSWEAEECQIGETARGFEQAGYREDAMAVRCQSKWAKVAPSCIALDR